MKTITAALLASAIAFPALAGDVFSTGDSHGPRQPNGQTDDYNRESYNRLPAALAKPAAQSWVDTPWGYTGQGTSGYVDPRPADLKDIQAANKAAADETYDRLVEQGGCRAPAVPFAIAVACDEFMVSHSAFGGDQSGQMGSAD